MPILRLIGDEWSRDSKVNFSYDPNKAVKDYRPNLMKLLNLRNIREYTFWHVAEDGESPDMDRDPLNLDWKWSDFGFQPNMFVYLRKSQPGDRKCDPNAKPNPPKSVTPPPAPTAAPAAPAADPQAESATVIHLIGDRWIKEQRKVLALKPHEPIEKYLPAIGKKLEIEVTVESTKEVGGWSIWHVTANGMRADTDTPPLNPLKSWSDCAIKHKGVIYLRQRKEGDLQYAEEGAAETASVPVEAAEPVEVPVPEPAAVSASVTQNEEVPLPPAPAVEEVPPPPPPPRPTVEVQSPTSPVPVVPEPPVVTVLGAEGPPPMEEIVIVPEQIQPPSLETAMTNGMTVQQQPQHFPQEQYQQRPSPNLFSPPQLHRPDSDGTNAYLLGRIHQLEVQLATMAAKERFVEEREAALMASLGYPAVGGWKTSANKNEFSMNGGSGSSVDGSRLRGIVPSSPSTRIAMAAASSPFQQPDHGSPTRMMPTTMGCSPIAHLLEDDDLRKGAEDQLREIESSVQRRRQQTSAAVALYEMAHYGRHTSVNRAADIVGQGSPHTDFDANFRVRY